MAPSSSSVAETGKRVAKGCLRDCLVTVGIIIFLIVGACVYFHSRRPHFAGASPVTIGVHVSSYYPTNEYRTTITNRTACEAILREFKQARPIFGGTMVVGDFTVRYDNGTIDIIAFLPGLSHGQYSILQGGTCFWMPSERFYKVLKDGGVDVSRIPKD